MEFNNNRTHMLGPQQQQQQDGLVLQAHGLPPTLSGSLNE
jgi:hypothetical protein